MPRMSILRTDPKKELEGVWRTTPDGFQLLVARMRNPRFEEYILSQGGLLRAAQETGRSNLAHEVTREAVARTVLLDWKDVLDDEDKPIPFSHEKALEFFVKFPEFYTTVVMFAADRASYQAEVAENIAGNSAAA